MEQALKKFEEIVSEDPIYSKMIGNLSSWGVAATFIYTFSFPVPPVGMILGTLLML